MLELGQRAEVQRAFSASQVQRFSALIEGSRESDQTVVPHALVASLFSFLLGTACPGPGTNYLKQSVKFHRNVMIDDMVVARVEITRIRADKALVDLSTKCWLGTPDGPLICEGRALVRVQDVEGWSPGAG